MQIHVCAKLGNIAGIASQITNGIDIDLVDEYSHLTPLMYAVSSANVGVDTMKFLIDNGADIDAVDKKFHKTVLCLAMESGNIDKIRFLLDTGVDLHGQNSDVYNLLSHYTIFYLDCNRHQNLIPILNLLITSGVKFGERDHLAVELLSNLGRFDALKFLITAGADRTKLAWTELIEAIVLGSVADVKAAIDLGADLHVRDSIGRTPLLFSLHVGELDKAKLLLSSGANLQDVGESGKTPLMLAIESGNPDLLKWAIELGCDLDAIDDTGDTALIVAARSGATDCVSILLELGANPALINNYNNTAIQVASNLPITRKLLALERDPHDLTKINGEVLMLLLGTGDRSLQVSPEQYLAEKNRRFGNANPELIQVDFWQAMIRCGTSAYSARVCFDDEHDWIDRPTPVWCNNRYGTTLTELPDGRIVQIGGEHEDYYDPDFCIYNDVIVYDGRGNFQIYGYPQEVFSPTDFHSATLVGNSIYIIGNLGYVPDRIEGKTPVYHLNCDTFKIEKIETTGDNPGWIHEHQAYPIDRNQISIDGGKIVVMQDNKQVLIDNSGQYVLDSIDLNWSRGEP
jgi:ankyrin repeat protein